MFCYQNGKLYFEKDGELVGVNVTPTGTTLKGDKSTFSTGDRLTYYEVKCCFGIFQGESYNFPTEKVTLKYVAGTGGKVSPASETVDKFGGKPKGSTATADSGYTFKDWTNSAGQQVSTSAKYVPPTTKSDTFTANFTADQP